MLERKTKRGFKKHEGAEAMTPVKKETDPEKKKEKIRLPPEVRQFLSKRYYVVGIISALITPILMILTIITFGSSSKAMPFMPLAIMLGISPYFTYMYLDYQRVKQIEDAFPEFLRSITEAKRSGINLSQAIIRSRQTEYGPLSDEIKIMSGQLSWGIPFPEVMHQFEKRMIRSDYIRRAVAIILEAYRSGGNVTDAMTSVAQNARILKELEFERQMKLSQQVVIMYVIFFIFLGMIVALHKILTPLLRIQSTSVTGYGSGASGTSMMGGLTESGMTSKYYRRLFFHMILIQAFFQGLIAGQLAENSPVAGIKHSAVMLVAGIVIFSIALPEVEILLSAEEPTRSYTSGEKFQLSVIATYEDGKPVQDGSVDITIGESNYRTNVDQAGVISYTLTLPEEPSTYDVWITVKDKDKREGTGKITILIEEPS